MLHTYSLSQNERKGIKAGDKLIVTSRYYSEVVTVVRTTKTLIVINHGDGTRERKFSIPHGHETGVSSSSFIGRSYLNKYTPEAADEILVHQLVGGVHAFSEEIERATRRLRNHVKTEKHAISPGQLTAAYDQMVAVRDLIHTLTGDIAE